MAKSEFLTSFDTDVLRRDWIQTRYIEVAGPEQYSSTDIARALSSALGRTTETVAVPREKWTELFARQDLRKACTDAVVTTPETRDEFIGCGNLNSKSQSQAAS